MKKITFLSILLFFALLLLSRSTASEISELIGNKTEANVPLFCQFTPDSDGCLSSGCECNSRKRCCLGSGPSLSICVSNRCCRGWNAPCGSRRECCRGLFCQLPPPGPPSSGPPPSGPGPQPLPGRCR